jgi:hypothetical protein
VARKWNERKRIQIEQVGLYSPYTFVLCSSHTLSEPALTFLPKVNIVTNKNITLEDEGISIGVGGLNIIFAHSC